MRRAAFVLGISAAACALALAGERDASACGGCFHPPTQTASDITDERMLLSVSPKQTTLYDQIRYQGNPSSFAWVLPIHGTVDVGLSADVLFDSVDVLTQTTITAPQVSCAPPPAECRSNSAPTAGSAGGSASDGVTVTKAENVGPYETVQLHATDSSALNKWLADNGFVIPADVSPIIAQYVTEGFDFLAMKLLPNQGVHSMRPVRVTSPGASLSLPLRMAAIGTGNTVGITIWVVSDGRYEPQNFPFFHIDDSELVWDFATQSSNYTTLRQKYATQFQGKGWEMETSLNLNQELISGVINSGGRYYGNGNGGPGGAIPPSNASDDYLPVTSSAPDGGADSGVTASADQVRTEDIKTLFAGMTGPNVRVTRMRSDISHAAMNVDFTLRASQDQSELSNIRVVTNSLNATCPVYDGCQVVGSAPAGTESSSTLGGGPAGSGCAATSTRGPGDLKYAGVFGLLGLAALRLARRRKARNASKSQGQ
jgi:MYXO-CTERM domain-containing protein